MYETVGIDSVPEKVRGLYKLLLKPETPQFADTKLALLKEFNENRPGDGFVYVVHSHTFQISFVFTPKGAFKGMVRGSL